MAASNEIEWLKEDWMQDPSYNIEVAPGFEEHREELRAWRFAFEADYEKLEDEQLRARAHHHDRTVERQKAIEDASLMERRHRKAASHALQELFHAAGLGPFGPGPENLGDALDVLVDDLVRSAEARAEMMRLSAD